MVSFARYARALCAAIRGAPGVAAIIAGLCAVIPFGVQLALHPQELSLLIAQLSGTRLPPPVAEVVALAALATFALSLFGAQAAFYRRIPSRVPLWPAVFLWAVAANSLWWLSAGSFDLEGMLAGFAPAALMVLAA